MERRKISNGNDADQTRSFNLVDEPWIPVVDFNGKTRLVGLKELFATADQLSDLAVGTLERIAIVRLLICIAQRVLEVAKHAPEDYDDWIESRDKIVPSVSVYFDQWRDRFDLYGDYPFLQVKNLKVASKSGDSSKTDKLDFGLSSGNNSTLFDQFAMKEGRVHSDAWLTIYLMVYQLFSPGGTIGKAEWNGKPTDGNGSSNSAPGIEGGALFSILMGDSLLDTIFGNTFPLSDDLKLTSGKPIWEYDLKQLSESEKKKIVSSYYGRLVPLSRTVRLDENDRDMILANGLTFLKLPDSREPMATVVAVKSKEGWEYVKTDPLCHPWRNLHSILSLNQRNAKDFRGGAYFLQNISPLLEERAGLSFKLWTGGVLANQAKIVDTASWTFQFNEKSLEEGTLRLYESGVALARRAEFRLVDAIKEYLSQIKLESQKKNLKSTFSSLVARVQSLFWTAMDQKYEILIKCAENSDLPENSANPLRDWENLLKKAMKAVYEQTCPHRTARQLQAYAAGERLLYQPKNARFADKKSTKNGKSTKKTKE